MVRIDLRHGEKNKTILASEMKPIRTILIEEGLAVTPFDAVTLNGRNFTYDNLDQNMLDLGIPGDTDVTISVNESIPRTDTDNRRPAADTAGELPGVRILGCACVIISSFTPDELRDMHRYMPEGMTMLDEQGGSLFAITLDEAGPGSLTKDGAVFSRFTNIHGKATITILLDPECDDPEELVRKSIGSAIIRLTEMEKRMTSRMNEMQQKKEQLDQYIMKE